MFHWNMSKVCKSLLCECTKTKIHVWKTEDRMNLMEPNKRIYSYPLILISFKHTQHGYGYKHIDITWFSLATVTAADSCWNTDEKGVNISLVSWLWQRINNEIFEYQQETLWITRFYRILQQSLHIKMRLCERSGTVSFFLLKLNWKPLV